MLLLKDQVDLQSYNTFHIRALARQFVRISSATDFLDLIRNRADAAKKHLILGGGSNILFTGDYDGLVIKNEITGIDIVDENDDYVTVRAGAGERWHSLVEYCVDHDWGGIENLSLIPGTVGAAPMQNIGAYGVEICDTVQVVEAIEIATGRVRQFSKEECKFGYRESIFKNALKGMWFISSVTLKLTKRDHRLNTTYGALKELFGERVGSPSIREVSEAVIAIRRSKLPDPDIIGNAGSFFKNPSIDEASLNFIRKNGVPVPTFTGEQGLTKVPAAWLIEQCGWKGATFGNIGVHKNQALVIVNYGGATGEEIWELAMRIQESVKEKFRVTLQPEVNVIHP
jgi:UDP-N-acetylmuramate dehydrogenase